MEINNVITYIEPEWTERQKLISSAAASPFPLITQINSYLMDNSGKQIRPILSLLSAKMFGAPTQLSTVVAAVVEMVHTATLLHDDVIDKSDTRRGALTVQKLFSPLSSVLLGDFWLARAFQLLMDNKGESLLCYFARAIHEMSEGELFQMEKAMMRNTTILEYNQIIRKKTAVLVAAGMVSAARTTGATDQQCNVIEDIAIHLGIAFQIRDDILDYSPQLYTGKPSGQDLMEGKLTLPLLAAFEQAPQTELREAEMWIQELPEKPELFTKITDFVHRNKGIEFAQREIEKKESEIKTLLLQCPNNASRHYLEEVATYLSNRNT